LRGAEPVNARQGTQPRAGVQVDRIVPQSLHNHLVTGTYIFLLSRKATCIEHLCDSGQGARRSSLLILESVEERFRRPAINAARTRETSEASVQLSFRNGFVRFRGCEYWIGGGHMQTITAKSR